MRYLDQYVRMVAKNFEKELARVALTDVQARIYCDSAALNELLSKIVTGDIRPPSTQFESVAQNFIPDEKYSSWARNLYFEKQETKLFSVCADLSNTLTTINDAEFAKYCLRAGYVFPDGWPNDPKLFANTSDKTLHPTEAAPKQEHHGWLRKFLKHLVGDRT